MPKSLCVTWSSNTGRGPRAALLERSRAESLRMVGRGRMGELRGDRAVAPPQTSAKSHHHGSPFSQAVSEGHRLGERQEAVDTVRGRQELAKSQQDVRDVSFRFARPRSGVQKGRTLPLRVWVSRPHVDGG